MAGLRAIVALFAVFFGLTMAAVPEVLEDTLVRQACPDYCWLGSDLPNIRAVIDRRCPGGVNSAVACTRPRAGSRSKLGRGLTCGCNGGGTGGSSNSFGQVAPPTPAGPISCGQTVISGDDVNISFTLNPGLSRTVTVAYQFYSNPDSLTVTSGGRQVFATGSVSGTGTRTVTASGTMTFAIFAPGDTAWDFSVTC